MYFFFFACRNDKGMKRVDGIYPISAGPGSAFRSLVAFVHDTCIVYGYLSMLGSG